jgi:hypothetical protein
MIERTKGEEVKAILPEGKEQLASCYYMFHGGDSIANAKFICLAVNYHDRLVEELRKLSQYPSNKYCNCDICKQVMFARNLLSEIEAAK